MQAKGRERRATQILDCPDGVLSSWPGRAADDTAKIGAMEVRVFVGENVGVDVAKRRVWPVFESVVEGLNDFLLEPGRAGVGRNHGVALLVWELLVGDTEHVHLDASGDEGDDWVHVHWDIRRRVQGDSGPHEIDVALIDVVSFQGYGDSLLNPLIEEALAPIPED